MNINQPHQIIENRPSPYAALGKNLSKNALRARACRYYREMVLRGIIWRCWQTLRGRSTTLLDFDTVQASLQLENACERGVHTIPLNKIYGSVNRSQDYDGKFHAYKRNVRDERWLRVAEMVLLEKHQPAIDVIELDGLYFVKDGHHRVSAARIFGMHFIDANITHYQSKTTVNTKEKSISRIRRQVPRTV